MILIIFKKKHKIAYQMWVAASLKVQVYLKFELIRVHMGWQNSHKTIKQEVPSPPTPPHTHTHTHN